MSNSTAPPLAEKRPHALVAHGDTRIDDYFWLRERGDPAVMAYLEAENAYTEQVLAPTAELQERLFTELRSHVQETDESAPVPSGPWHYYSRTVEDSQYAIHCRRPRDTDGPESVLLDGNIVAANHDFFEIGDFVVSPDHSLLAYSYEFDGGERYELHVRDLATNRDLPDVIPNVYYSVAWADDNRTLFYTRPDEAMRPFEVWRHALGTDPTDDVLVWRDDDDRFDVWVHRTRSGAFVLFGATSRTTTEVWCIPSGEPLATPRVVEPRRDGVEYHVEHRGDDFLIWSNEAGATNFALYRTPAAQPARAAWEVLQPHDAAVRIAQVLAFHDFVMLYERCNGLERLRPLGDVDAIALPDPVYSVWPGANREYDARVFRYEYSSLVAPRSSYDYDVAARTSVLVKRQPVPGYAPEEFVAARAWATAPDGTAVPISLVHRRDVALDGTAPLYLYGYGSYEASIDPVFDASALPLLDRGWVYAIAHPRGGGELGRAWYEAGKLEHKMNTFTDFIAAADHLAAAQVCAPDKIVARGGSAGGLLMGAITHLCPERFRAIVAEVPFVDVLSTMSDPSIPLTVNEWEEWGNPAVETEYRAMRAYSPYDNLASGVRYPRMLVTGGLNDPRVQYWEPAKFVAKLRAISPDTDVILKTEMGAGHAGPSGRYDAWRDEALVLAFMLTSVDTLS